MNLIWFRNDLRIDDNPALNAALTSCHSCCAVYISTPKQWQRHGMAHIKADLINRHLKLLNQQLAEFGVPFFHIQSDDFETQIDDLTAFVKARNIDSIFANKEVELNETKRDQAIIEKGLPLHLYEADVILPKGSIVNQQGKMYQVFTPFKKAWVAQLMRSGATPISPPQNKKPIQAQVIDDIELTPQTLAPQNAPHFPLTSEKWPLADQVLNQVVPRFLEHKHANYAKDRDYPFQKATSGLSPYLAIGAISPRRLLAMLLERDPFLLDKQGQDEFSWLNELIWREFYRHLIFHQPRLCRYTSFRPQFDNLDWPSNDALFQAWCLGQTGYPIVDAAMRQLQQTGWMHNRLRMIVASFATKHLLIDWRRGEHFFIHHLIDGDLCANNGGWQWSAGSGCDAQPYFRIFNPITQSQKFDPQGVFIRKFVPELSQVPDKEIHFPHAYLEQNSHINYVKPIVEHKTARSQALDFYQATKNKSDLE